MLTPVLLDPESHPVEPPAVWLDIAEVGAQVIDGGLVNNWGGNTTAFQPAAGSQPTYRNASKGEVEFSGGEFLFLNDSDLDLSEYSALVQFKVDATMPSDASLFGATGLQMAVGGSSNAAHAQTLMVRRDGETIHGPPLLLGEPTQATISGGEFAGSLSINGTGVYRSNGGAGPLPQAFGTIGCSFPLTDSSPSDFLNGALQELILFDVELDSRTLSRLEDYQLSRWQSVVLWDFRNSIVPVMLSGVADSRNSLSGGWGSDSLTGGNLDDILRGGPSSDILAGGPGADRFQFLETEGQDVILDFSESERDVLDLSPLLGKQDGLPGDFLELAAVIDYTTLPTPTVCTEVRIDFDGDGGDPDMKITLQGVVLSNSDLPRLVDSGRFYLGGPAYPVSFQLALSEEALVETEYPRELTVTRVGDISAEREIHLSFVGSADAGVDYAVPDLNGVIRKVIFAAGEGEAVVALTPIQDALPESEKIEVAVVPLLGNSLVFDTPLEIALEDAPSVTVQVLQPYAQHLGRVPGLVAVNRDGDLTQPMNVALQYTGSATNGIDYEPLSPVLTFPAGVDTLQLEVKPAENSPLWRQSLLAQVGVTPDTTKYATSSPWAGSVMLLNTIGVDGPQIFGDFRDENFPGDLTSDEDLMAIDHDQDTINTLSEYFYGTDPNTANVYGAFKVLGLDSSGHLLLQVITRAGLRDASVKLQLSRNLVNWSTAVDDFVMDYQLLEDGRIRRNYRARVPAELSDDPCYYRVGFDLVSSPDLDAGIAEAIGLPGSKFFALSGPGWVPAEDGGSLLAPVLDESSTSSFATSIEGPFTATFEWQADDIHQLTVSIDGVEQTNATDTGGWVSANINSADEGTHQVTWAVQRLVGESSSPSEAALRNLIISQP